MAPDDNATQAELDIVAALESELSTPSYGGSMSFGGPVVAGPPDDALAHARLEIAAALGGYPTPGAMF
jgi:hypothetical protein